MLTSANACGLPVDAAASEGLRVRWVMAGMPADAASPQLIRISPETTLRTGDKIKMYLKAVNECFFYLFHHGPEGRLRLVYPDALPAKMLASGTRLTVPRGDQWFELDENTGTETFYVLVSPAPCVPSRPCMRPIGSIPLKTAMRSHASSRSSNGCATSKDP